MRNLFTTQELETGYIIEGKSTSRKIPLDLERIGLLKGKEYDLIFLINKIELSFIF